MAFDFFFSSQNAWNFIKIFQHFQQTLPHKFLHTKMFKTFFLIPWKKLKKSQKKLFFLLLNSSKFSTTEKIWELSQTTDERELSAVKGNSMLCSTQNYVINFFSFSILFSSFRLCKCEWWACALFGVSFWGIFLNFCRRLEGHFNYLKGLRGS